MLLEARRRATERSLRDGVEVVRRRCKTLVGFIREAWPILEPATPYKHGRVVDVVAAHLEAITNGTFLKLGLSNRVLINVPPGTMKSLMASVLWPAWEWGPCGLPHLRYVSTSFSDYNVERDCRKMRDLVDSDWYQQLWPDTSLSRRAVTDFANAKHGGRVGIPFPSLTGGRGDRVIIDDPHSTETAESEADRKTAVRIFRESVPTRVNDPVKSAIVIIMQRLHQQDVSGTALALGLGYIHVMLPMEFEPDRAFKSPLGDKWSDWRTKPGELLFPERFPQATVDRDKIPLGSYGTAGQFQQRPVPRGGLMFKRDKFKFVAQAPADCSWVRGWDLAGSQGDGSPFTVGLKLGRDRKGNFYVAHIVRERTEDPESLIKRTAEADGKLCRVDAPQDPGSAGKIQARAITRSLAGYLVSATPESGDKITRARPVAAQVEAGNFYVVGSPADPWVETFLSEVELFPLGTFKDQVDALSRAFGRFVLSPDSAVVVPIVITQPFAAFGDHPGYS